MGIRFQKRGRGGERRGRPETGLLQKIVKEREKGVCSTVLDNQENSA